MTNRIMELADRYAEAYNHMTDLGDEGEARAALLTEVERVRKDAERYQWLREQDDHSPVFCMYGSNGPWGECGHSDIYGELLDKSIDDAMKEPS